MCKVDWVISSAATWLENKLTQYFINKYSRLEPTSNRTIGLTVSAILLKCEVTEIGRKLENPTDADTFGTGVTNALSQQLGTLPVEKEHVQKCVCNNISKLIRAVT